MAVAPSEMVSTASFGIDIGKTTCAAGVVSTQILARHRNCYEKCPAIEFKNDGDGFEKLLAFLRKHGPPGASVLLERTGHYGLALAHYLQSRGYVVYEVRPQERIGEQKTDALDARRLANALHSQFTLGVVPEKSQRARPLEIPPETIARIQALIARRDALTRALVRIDNQLIAYGDQIFPEFREAIKDTVCDNALKIRESFPSPKDIAGTDIEALRGVLRGGQPGRPALRRLQELAKKSVGEQDEAKCTILLLAQTQLIAEHHLLASHREILDAQIIPLVKDCRAGQILISFPMISPILAAQLLAALVSITHYEDASNFRGYAGYGPIRRQSGTTMDSMIKKKRRGNKDLKVATWLITMAAIRLDTEWREAYNELVERLCPLVAGKRIRKNRVVARIAGNILGVIFALLKKDHDIIATLKDGEEAPCPTLYSREKHHADRVNGKGRRSKGNKG